MHTDSRVSFPPYQWPSGKRCAVIFSLDLDAEAPFLWLHRQQNVKHLGEIEQRRYGPRQGVSRILDLLKRYGIAGSFYVPGIVAHTYPALLPELLSHGHEVAYHGYYHERLDLISKDDAHHMTDKTLEIFYKQTGLSNLGYRAPSWEMTAEVLELLIQKGIAYDSSLMGFDHPYEINGLTEIPPQWVVDDALYFRYTNSPRDKTHPANPVAVLESWIEAFEGARQYGGVFMITVHDWISGQTQRLRLLEKLFQHIRQYDDIWWTRSDELATWHQQSINQGVYSVTAQSINTQF